MTGFRCRVLARASAIGVTAAAGLVLFAVPAFAHITVTSSSAAPGSAAVLTFHVPDEEAKASTVQLDVLLPAGHPIAQLLVKPVPGWTVAVKTVTLAKPLVTDDGSFSQAVSEVIWSGGTIAPGQFQDFSMSADPLPQGAGQLVFKALQTYSNGDVVRWIDIPQAGQPEPDHPAPVLTLTAGPAPAPGAASSAPSTGAASSSSSGSSTLALGAGIGGLIFGLAGLAVAVLTWRRRGQPPGEPHPAAAAEPTLPVPASRRKTSGSRRP